MQQAVANPQITWPRGNARWWAITQEESGSYVITYRAGWPSAEQSRDNPYMPAAEPHLFEHFAHIGRVAADREAPATAGYTVRQASGTLVRTIFGSGVSSAERAAASAEDDPQVRKLVLGFLRDYGCPASRSTGGRWALQEFLVEAACLATAVDIVRAEQASAELDARADPADTARLASLMNPHLADVHPVLTPSGQPAMAVDELLDLMWLQLYEARAGGHHWNTCRGCGLTFFGRRGQEFHDRACRRRYHVKRSPSYAARRKKGGPQ